MNNQFLLYSILALICVGVIIVLTLLYMKRRNLKLFEQEEKRLLEQANIQKKKKAKEDMAIEKKKIEEPEQEVEVKVKKINIDPIAPKANLEEVLEKMQADLDKKEDVVALFEQEQEEKAIISYQELLNSKNKNTTGANQELLSVIQQIENGKQETGTVLQPDYRLEEVEVEDIEEPKLDKKFRNTEFISPVYGKVENRTQYPTIPNFKDVKKRHTRSSKNQMEVSTTPETAVVEDEELRNDAFLNALKKFRNNL